jgi:dolichol-phosphate mannosyltransferase
MEPPILLGVIATTVKFERSWIEQQKSLLHRKPFEMSQATTEANHENRPHVGDARVTRVDAASTQTAIAPRRENGQPFAASKFFVVLPAFNEEDALPPLLEAVGEAFADSGLPYEVIIVDDGSKDRTAEIASQASFRMPVHLVQHQVNQGLGITLLDGLREASKRCGDNDIIVTMDADNTHPPGLIYRMGRMIKEGCDVVTASRFQSGARVIGVPWNRAFLSIGARVLFTTVFPTRGVRDYTSGYRCYRGRTIKDAFARYGDNLVSTAGFACMCDVLLKLRKQGAIFAEVPLLLRYDQKGGVSKMKVLKTIVNTLKLLAAHRMGKMG